MSGSILCIAAAVLAIDAGWRPLDDGGVVYLIQIEPEMLDTLRAGEAVESDIPPHVKDVRGYRITVGSEKLPRELPPAPADESPEKPKATASLGFPDFSQPTELGQQFGPPSAPNTLPAAPRSRPIVEPAVALLTPAETAPSSTPSPNSVSSPKPARKSTSDSSRQQDDSAKPWLPLTLALFVLFTSLGGNAYLLWIATDFHRRYRALLQRIAADPLHSSGLE